MRALVLVYTLTDGGWARLTLHKTNPDALQLTSEIEAWMLQQMLQEVWCGKHTRDTVCIDELGQLPQQGEA